MRARSAAFVRLLVLVALHAFGAAVARLEGDVGRARLPHKGLVCFRWRWHRRAELRHVRRPLLLEVRGQHQARSKKDKLSLSEYEKLMEKTAANRVVAARSDAAA